MHQALPHGRSCLKREKGLITRARFAQILEGEFTMHRIGLDDEINYRYGNGPKPPHMNGASVIA